MTLSSVNALYRSPLFSSFVRPADKKNKVHKLNKNTEKRFCWNEIRNATSFQHGNFSRSGTSLQTLASHAVVLEDKVMKSHSRHFNVATSFERKADTSSSSSPFSGNSRYDLLSVRSMKENGSFAIAIFSKTTKMRTFSPFRE